MDAYIVLVAKLWDLTVFERDVLDRLENKGRVLKRPISFLGRNESQMRLELTISAMMYYFVQHSDDTAELFGLLYQVIDAGLCPGPKMKRDVLTIIHCEYAL